MTRLVVAPEAESDTTEILDTLQTKAGGAVAARYADRFREVVQRLIEMPRSGARKPALGHNTRCMIVPPYVLICDYTVADDTVTLLRMLHGRRRITARMRPRQ
jgi:toxin ParE1/3/4